MVSIVRGRVAQARTKLANLAFAASVFGLASGFRSVEKDFNIRLRFVVGHLQEPTDQALLDEEQHVHNDFLVMDLKETYDNLVLKVHASENY